MGFVSVPPLGSHKLADVEVDRDPQTETTGPETRRPRGRLVGHALHGDVVEVHLEGGRGRGGWEQGSGSN